MRKSKSIIAAVIIAAIALFVVAAVSTVITGGSENYERPAPVMPPVSDSTPVTEAVPEVDETAVSEQAEQAMADEQQALAESASQQAVDATAEVVDSATEASIETTESLANKTNEAIAAAEQAAVEGRAEAEKMLEEVTQEAEKTVVTTQEAVEATGKVHTVSAQGLVYNPMVIKIAPGDKVSWTNMSTHNTEAIEGLVPEGTELWMSQMSDNYSRTFMQEGIYIYKCTPHFGAGMGGAIIVGQPVNLEQIQNAGATGAAKRLVNKALEVAEAM